MMKQIVLDTSFVISSLKFKIPIEEELSRVCDFKFEICVLSATLAELERLINKGKLFEKRLSALALGFARKKASIIKAEGYVDKLLLELNPETAIVATLDAKLKKELMSKGFGVITIRQKNQFLLEKGYKNVL